MFSALELATLEEINQRLGGLSTSEIVAISHREAVWMGHYPNKGVIPYSDAYQILL